jgi:dienelactone hydrolase
MKHAAIQYGCIQAFLLGAAIAGASPVPRATFAVSPAQPLMDDRLGISVSGLPPNHLIAVKVQSKAQDQHWWRSEAVFNSGPQGVVDLQTQAPVSGAYQGVDGMGLFWSMQPDPDTKSGDHAFYAVSDWFQPIVTEIEANDAGRVLGSVVIERRFSRPGLRCTPVAEPGIVGVMCDPGDGRRHPGVMILGGSEGGLGEPDAALLLASRGFTSLSLAYFGAKGLPATLQNIPLEYFSQALEWLRARPETDPRFVGVLGVSRGAEAALQFAASDPDVNAIVARSPSHVRWEGATAKQLPGGPVWTWRGQPLSYAPIHIPLWFGARFVWDLVWGNPTPFTPLFLYNLQALGDTAKVEIPVENIHGPVLLLSGQDDQKWPSSLMAERLMDRLQKHGHLYADRHLSYAGVGHWIPFEYLPTAGSGHGMIGGTPQATARAQADSWPQILQFFIQAARQKQSRP